MPREFHKQFAEMAIDALGGNTKVAELFGVDERLVSMWRLRGLPPNTYAAMAPLLVEAGRDAPAIMFRQRMVIRKRVTRPSRPPSRNGNRKARK
jgi:hypothetical protein